MNDHEKQWDMKHPQNDLMHVLHRPVELTGQHRTFLGYVVEFSAKRVVPAQPTHREIIIQGQENIVSVGSLFGQPSAVTDLKDDVVHISGYLRFGRQFSGCHYRLYKPATMLPVWICSRYLSSSFIEHPQRLIIACMWQAELTVSHWRALLCPKNVCYFLD